MVPPLVALEEHYLSKHILSFLGPNNHYTTFPPGLVDKLKDVDAARLAELDAGYISLQILSHGPLNAPPAECRLANDDLAAAIKRNPGRLAGFAMLPMASPAEAAEELRRCVRELGFVGALINNHLDGTFYDDERFWTVFATAQELDVPVYIHPTFAADEALEHHRGNFPEQAARMMSGAGWSWHTETGLHVLRLWTAGLFDRFPKLKLIIGHMGEMLPFQLDRILPMARLWVKQKPVQRDLLDVWRENFWFTTSGMFSLAPMACLLKTTSVERVMYSVDYPFSPNERGVKFVEALEGSDLVTKEELELICHGNAEKLLGLKVRKDSTL